MTHTKQNRADLIAMHAQATRQAYDNGSKYTRVDWLPDVSAAMTMTLADALSDVSWSAWHAVPGLRVGW